MLTLATQINQHICVYGAYKLEPQFYPEIKALLAKGTVFLVIRYSYFPTKYYV